MVKKEPWYLEAAGSMEESYARLLQEWARGDHNPEDAEEILRLHHRLGKDPSELEWMMQHLEWEDVEDIPLDLLPPVSFQITYRIERFIDSTWYGTAASGFVGPDGELSREAGSNTLHTMKVDAFFDMLEDQGWGDWGWSEGGHRITLRGPSSEFESESGSVSNAHLEKMFPNLQAAVSETSHWWDVNYGDGEDLDEQYIQEMGYWKTTLVIVDPEGQEIYWGQHSYTSQVVADWARGADIL